MKIDFELFFIFEGEGGGGVFLSFGSMGVGVVGWKEKNILVLCQK